MHRAHQAAGLRRLVDRHLPVHHVSDGEQTTERSTWHYSGAYEIKEVHPTRGPGSQFCQDLENPDEGGGGG